MRSKRPGEDLHQQVRVVNLFEFQLNGAWENLRGPFRGFFGKPKRFRKIFGTKFHHDGVCISVHHHSIMFVSVGDRILLLYKFFRFFQEVSTVRSDRRGNGKTWKVADDGSGESVNRVGGDFQSQLQQGRTKGESEVSLAASNEQDLVEEHTCRPF
jgi:hypothetical protein